jgi:hypothetical protein
MNLKKSLPSAFVAIALVSSAIAFSPTLEATNCKGGKYKLAQSKATTRLSSTALPYKNYHSSYYEIVDVDGDRMSLLSLLDPPAGLRVDAPSSPEEQSIASQDTSSRSAQRASPITQLHSIQDYHRHVLNEPNQLCIIRFSAPWCKVCKSTNVAWERMASKIMKTVDNKRKIKFFSVSLDGKGSVVALKDMLQIRRVPQGIIHHPTQGVFGQRIDLNRNNLSSLKKQLEKYLEDGKMGSGMVLDGLHARLTD